MKTTITFRNIIKESHASTREYVEQLVEKHLRPHVASFSPSQLHLHATIAHRKKAYTVSIRLHLPPKKVLVAKASNEHLKPALQKAIEELGRQAERHRAHISGQEQWKRKQRRQRIRNLKSMIASANLPEQTEVTLAALLPRLESYIRHELTYLRANGDLPENYPTVTDIRDEVFLQLQSQWDKLEHTEEALYQAMLKAVSEILDAEVRQTRVKEKMVSLESAVEPDATEQAEAMVEEEINEFYQPDEVLHVEDLVPDSEIETPEQVAEDETVDACYQLLGNLPTQWRRIVTLVHREHMTPQDVAENILRLDLQTVQNILDNAENFIQAHLQERGLEKLTLAEVLKKK